MKPGLFRWHHAWELCPGSLMHCTAIMDCRLWHFGNRIYGLPCRVSIWENVRFYWFSIDLLIVLSWANATDILSHFLRDGFHFVNFILLRSKDIDEKIEVWEIYLDSFYLAMQLTVPNWRGPEFVFHFFSPKLLFWRNSHSKLQACVGLIGRIGDRRNTWTGPWFWLGLDGRHQDSAAPSRRNCCRKKHNLFRKELFVVVSVTKAGWLEAPRRGC